MNSKKLCSGSSSRFLYVAVAGLSGSGKHDTVVTFLIPKIEVGYQNRHVTHTGYVYT